MRIAVFGAGAWGTALAIHAARRHPVLLWTRDPAQAEAIRIEQPSTAPAASGAAWLVELRNAKNIRHAIIARELLGPPAGLR